MNHITDETLNEYLDNELTDRAEVEMHLSQCADCAARLTALQTLFTQIESLPELTLSRSLAAPFTRRDVGFALPRWLKLIATLQIVAAFVSIMFAVPLIENFVPPVEIPSFTEVLMELQTQWTIWFDTLSQIQLPALPEYSISMEVSSLFLMSMLAVLFILWIAGNGLLLKNQITKRRTS